MATSPAAAALVHFQQAYAAQEHNQFAEAIAGYQRALTLLPNLAEAHNNLGLIYQAQGNIAPAAAAFRRAIELRPNYYEAYCSLGLILEAQGNKADAIACYQRAVELEPTCVEAHNNLGTALQDQGKVEEAADHFRRTIELQPDFAEGHSNLGAAFHEQGLFDSALACFRRALELQPRFAPAHYNLGLILLRNADFERGWPEYEWRKPSPVNPLVFAPAWKGEELAGKTILIRAEQGFGDTIQFVRYLPIVRERGGHVLLECQTPLRQLLANSAELFIAQDGTFPKCDVQARLLSLPGILRTTLSTIPAPIPYLSAEPSLVESWRNRLSQIPGFKIGIGWQGNPAYPLDRCRSLRLSQFAKIAKTPGVNLISLQKGVGTEQLDECRTQFSILEFTSELDEASGPFMDTAAIMANLDLVITSDSALAHLAGALGVPVWIALPFVPDWRWHLNCATSPWYPTARLFRQSQPGNWDDVFAQMQIALAELTATRTPPIAANRSAR